jgi:integrase
MVASSTVLDLADAIGDELRAFVLLAGFGGLRTGELLGLRRLDVDELHGIVHVRRQVHEVAGKVRRMAGASVRVVTAPKSEAGLRTVAIPRAVMQALAAHLQAHTGLDPESPVFASRAGNQPLRRADLSKAWRAAVSAVPETPAGLHVHDLRHHAATTMARMPGVTTKELMARIGHSSPRAALIYQHATEERDQAVADYLDAQIAAVERPARATAPRRIG